MFDLFVLYATSVATISANLNSILILNESNFKDWKKKIFIDLGCIDLDLALRIERLITPTDSSSFVDKGNYEKWESSNHESHDH